MGYISMSGEKKTTNNLQRECSKQVPKGTKSFIQ